MMLTATLFLCLLPLINANVPIIIAPKPGDEGKANACTYMCTGNTGIGKSTWGQYPPGGLSMGVSLQECGFTTSPIVVISLEGGNQEGAETGAEMSGSAFVHRVGKDYFSIYMEGYVYTSRSQKRVVPDKAWAKDRWSVNWVAVGATC